MTSLARKLRRSNALTRHRECPYPNYIFTSTGAYDFNFPRRTKINRLPLSTEAFLTAWFSLRSLLLRHRIPARLKSERAAASVARLIKDLSRNSRHAALLAYEPSAV